MRKVERSELVDYQTWADDVRPAQHADILALKKPRRVHVGPYLTFLFETTDTVRYQVQEMMRVEQIVKESAIAHELETYNELLGGPGELGCALLLEIPEQAERDRLLRAWHGMERHWYVKTAAGERAPAIYDPRQVADDGRLSSVQYLRFAPSGPVVAIGCDHPLYAHETALTAEQRDALAADLAG